MPSNEREGYYIGGKSGTSQTIDAKTGKYSNENTIATYLGFGGNDPAKPAYVIMTSVQGDGNYGGGTDAKPIFNDISNWMIDYLKLQPKG
jgi:cell division protein FtsI/penicillin-binding protein 2